MEYERPHNWNRHLIIGSLQSQGANHCVTTASSPAGDCLVSRAMAGVSLGSGLDADGTSRRTYGTSGRVRMESHGTKRGSVRLGLAGACDHRCLETRHLHSSWHADAGPTRLAHTEVSGNPAHV